MATASCRPIERRIHRLRFDGRTRNAAGVYPVHLAAVFRRFYHETIGDHVQKRRIEHAYDLLQKKDISLCEIAYECGFADQSHFTRVFKRRVGVTPGVFRSSLD